MTSSEKSLQVHLVGSSPFASSSDFFEAIKNSLPTQVHHLPDGETGARANFIAWQHSTLPIEIIQPRWGGQPTPESTAKTYTLSDIQLTGYDNEAIQSFEDFRRRKISGTIPTGVRFQVCLPTPLSVVRGFVEEDVVCAQVEPLYEARLLQALKNIQTNIPPSELAIQWDLPAEVALLEYEKGRVLDKYWRPYFESPITEKLVERLSRLAANVEPQAEMGFHLCYGDFGHVHFVQPEDMTLIVDLANEIVEKVGRLHEVQYFHMPVPKERDDVPYFLPLRDFRVEDATKLFLGVVHADDEDGTRRRLKAARTVYPRVDGIASECGLGRTPLEQIDEMLRIHSAVAEA